MREDFKDFLRQFPLIASKNPQLDLFTDVERDDFAVTQSRLYRWACNKLNLVLARYSHDRDTRTWAVSADRYRDITRAHAVKNQLDIDWPEFGTRDGLAGLQQAPLSEFYLEHLQSEEHAAELRRLLQEISQYMAWALSRPSAVFEDRHGIRVEFMDRIAWVGLKIERELKMELRDLDGNWQLTTLRFAVDQVCGSRTWIDHVLLGWIGEIVLAFGNGAEEAYRWIRHKLIKRFHNGRALAGLRQQVFQHLSVSPRVAKALIYTRKRTHGDTALMNNELSLLWRSIEAWNELVQDFPQLFPLFYQARAKPDKPINWNGSSVRKTCLDAGLTPGGWRYLLKLGEACYRSALGSGLFAPAKEFSAIIQFVQWQSLAQVDAALPGKLATPVLAFAMLEPDGGCTAGVKVDPRLARIGLEQWRNQEGRHEREAFEEKWTNVLIWMATTNPEIQKNQWRAGWNCIWRKYEKWLNDTSNSEGWNSTLKTMDLTNHLVVPLESTKDLCLEGAAMRNCVATYAERCRGGAYRLFSIQDQVTGARLATMGIEKHHDTWSLDQVRGFKNSEPPEEIETLAKRVADVYHQVELEMKARARPGASA